MSSLNKGFGDINSSIQLFWDTGCGSATVQDSRDTVLNKTDLLPTGTISPLNEFGSISRRHPQGHLQTGDHHWVKKILGVLLSSIFSLALSVSVSVSAWLSVSLSLSLSFSPADTAGNIVQWISPWHHAVSILQILSGKGQKTSS